MQSDFLYTKELSADPSKHRFRQGSTPHQIFQDIGATIWGGLQGAVKGFTKSGNPMGAVAGALGGAIEEGTRENPTYDEGTPITWEGI